MRFAPGLLAGLILAGAIPAAEPGKASASAESQRRRDEVASMEVRLLELDARSRQLYPRRRDTPLRYLNITDSEVRELQVIARKYRMSELLNISPVVEGCPCEEGGTCTEQVFIVGRVDQKVYGLELSRRKNLWTVGVVQRWWLERAALEAREKVMDIRSFQNARDRLLLEFPQCAPAGKPDTRSAQVAEPAKK
jgi:hypothetical protein